MHFKKIRIFSFVALLFVTVVGFSQEAPNPSGNFPYSSLGLGNLNDPYLASNAGMGGLAATYHDPFHLNPINPASLGWLRYTAFETGVFARRSLISSNDQESIIWDGNLNYMALGFPMRNPINELQDRIIPDFGWGMSFTLMPFSNVDYDIEKSSPLVDSTNVISSFTGDGGLYQLKWGNGFRYKDLAVGINLGYLFGRIKSNQQTRLDNELIYFFNDLADDINLNGLIWNIGVIYDYRFKKLNSEGNKINSDKKLSVGLYANSNTEINLTSDQLYQRIYAVTTTGVSASERRDTLFNQLDQEGTATLPGTFGIGLTYEQENKLRVGFEYYSSFWDNYEIDILSKQDEVLSNSFRIAAGVEYTPNFNSYNRYLAKVRYRLGGFYERDPRTIDGEQLNRYAATFGLGFPIILPRQQISFVNVALEVGQIGLENSITENYTQLTLGFTLNDNRWFFKRKFN